ncbi:hypothetical protein REPUB_Repub03eG0093800 [Reevesia pubescens]
MSKNSEHIFVSPTKSRWENMLSTSASLYPFLSLGLIMLAMHLTLEFKDLLNLFIQRPLSILFGCFAQYTIMPTFRWVISKTLELSPSFSVGLVLLASCHRGATSNVVTLIARKDVPLSTVTIVYTTIGVVIVTPFLTMILVGTYVTIDAIGLSISILHVIITPIMLGSYMQSLFPLVVKIFTPFAPLFAVLVSSILACRISVAYLLTHFSSRLS